MAPRKRAQPNFLRNNNKRTNSSASASPSQSTRIPSQLSSTSSSSSQPPTTHPPPSNTSSTTLSRDDQRVRKTSSWYTSWPRVSKASASTLVARDNVMGDTRHSGAVADFSRFETNNKEPSADSDRQSTTTLPTNANPDESSSPRGDSIVSSARQSAAVNPDGRPEDTPSAAESAAPPSHSSDKLPTSAGTNSQAPTNSNGWLSWLSGPVVYVVSKPKVDANDSTEIQQNNTVAVESSLPQNSQVPQPSEPPAPSESPQPPKSTKQASSWFAVWPYSYSANPTAKDDSEQAPPIEDNTGEHKAKESTEIIVQDAPTTSTPVPAPVSVTTQPSAGSTWAFWSRDTTSQKTGDAPPSKQGELAVMGDGSETSPKKSTVEINNEPSDMKEAPLKTPQRQSSKTGSTKKAKKGGIRPVDVEVPPLSRPGTPSSDTITKIPASKSTPTSVTPPNLLLPSFKSTYRMKQNPSIIKQITQLLLRTQQQPPNHVFLSKETPKVKKAMAIGVHGLFPASYLRPMIGQPTGTSIKFANHCADAIRRWADSNGSGECEISTVALEGEGKIGDRVENLWKLLLNWIEDIRNADLIMVACHSQGVPVGIMLLEKLIELGVITNSRIGVCAMAGVSLGPFPDYKSGMGILMGTAAELWQFADPASEVSQRYEHALKTVVEYGAHITYVGSIDDQLVPLQSALYGPACHPNIYRAVFIDGRIHAPDFIAHLVGFALKLRNLGISDHGLIRELSVPLAGSLYSGEGHSRLYDDGQVYDLAISHTLETTSASGAPCQVQQYDGLTNPNPYVLPWIMRGLLEEDFVKTELSHETAELLKQFDDWAPTTKALKDVKYRLEAVRSKL